MAMQPVPPRWDIVPSPRLTARVARVSDDIAIKGERRLVRAAADAARAVRRSRLHPRLAGPEARARSVGGFRRRVGAGVGARRRSIACSSRPTCSRPAPRDTIAFITTAGFVARARRTSARSQTSWRGARGARRACARMRHGDRELHAARDRADLRRRELDGKPMPRQPESRALRARGCRARARRAVARCAAARRERCSIPRASAACRRGRSSARARRSPISAASRSRCRSRTCVDARDRASCRSSRRRRPVHDRRRPRSPTSPVSRCPGAASISTLQWSHS